MDFSSLVLMERDKETNHLIRELGSYEVSDGARFITKMFYDGDKINVFFDTNKDVEEWQFTAIYDLFREEVFEEKGFEIEPSDNEYNPTWLVKFPYDEEHEIVQKKLSELCDTIESEIELVFDAIKDKESEYK